MLQYLIIDSNLPMLAKNTPPKLLDQVRDKIRVKHYSIRTEKLYVQWIKRFILFHGKRHPLEMGAVEVEAFLTHLAVESHVSASTQNQALSALLFLYNLLDPGYDIRMVQELLGHRMCIRR
ncbi:phage integrase N-terminal SAM-like domain-containing protein [Methylomicrobium lacus]|uniref:phage integrase N-terminal SAM-like domain-containing protein n=1 Tax=Methylomicrobium lacus TaxID=136992 RepID=UPI003CCBEC10